MVPSGPEWLTDYVLTNSLSQGYQAQIDQSNGAPPPPLGPVSAPVTPDIQQEVAAEVQNQVNRESNEAKQVAQGQPLDPADSSLGRILDGHPHALVAGADLEVQDQSGRTCALSPGDVVEVAKDQPENSAAAVLKVLSGKPQDCAKNDVVYILLADLQEIQNHMRVLIDAGLQAMQDNNGRPNFPRVPPSPVSQTPQPPLAADPPPPEPNIATEIAVQAQEAEQAEQAQGQPR
jgi:hypothetical protein